MSIAKGNGTPASENGTDEPQDGKEQRSKLLLVDDRRENLIALAAVLEPLGQELVLARSGAEALKHLLTDDFAAILLDVQMPDMDGFETATLIKQRERSRYIPILFITAISKDEKYVFRGYQTGAVDYLSKPIDSDMLRSKVRVFIELAEQRRKIQEQAEELRRAELREAELLREEEERQRERRHLEEVARRESQLRQFKTTLDATLDAVFLFHPESLRFTYVNQGAVRLFGYAEEEFLQMTPLELDAAGGKRELDAVLKPLRSGADPTEQTTLYETNVRHRSGTIIPVEVRTQFVSPPDGPNCFVSIVRDITERKNAESQLSRMYEREKRIAEALQQSIVLAPPEDLFPGLTISTMYQAAWDEASVGGDYLDVFALERGKAALVVGDVSGKGLTAAARTAEVKYALRAFLRETPDPARALGRLNTLLCETSQLDNSDLEGRPGFGQFICIAVVVVDPTTGEGKCALAGAEPPLLVRKDGEIESMTGSGMPVGITCEGVHENTTFQLQKGDLMMMMTDGITEARRGKNFFGYEGLIEATSAAAVGGNVHSIGRAVLDAARGFAGGKLQDDVCLLLATRH